MWSSPPQRTEVMAMLWLAMLNRQRRVCASHTCPRQRRASGKGHCTRQHSPYHLS